MPTTPNLPDAIRLLRRGVTKWEATQRRRSAELGAHHHATVEAEVRLHAYQVKLAQAQQALWATRPAC